MSYFTASLTSVPRGKDPPDAFHIFVTPPEVDADLGQRDSAFILCDPNVEEQPERFHKTVISKPLAREYKKAMVVKYGPIPGEAPGSEPLVGQMIEVVLRNDDDSSRVDLPVKIGEFADGYGDNYLRIGLIDLDPYFEMATDGNSIDLELKTVEETDRECYPS
jgi:hypothetical protein